MAIGKVTLCLALTQQPFTTLTPHMQLVLDQGEDFLPISVNYQDYKTSLDAINQAMGCNPE